MVRGLVRRIARRIAIEERKIRHRPLAGKKGPLQYCGKIPRASLDTRLSGSHGTFEY